MRLEEVVSQAIAQALRAPEEAKDIFAELDLELHRRGITSRALGEIINHLSQGGTLNSEQLQPLREEIWEREEGGISKSIPICHECGQTLVPKGLGSYWCFQCDPPPAHGT